MRGSGQVNVNTAALGPGSEPVAGLSPGLELVLGPSEPVLGLIVLNDMTEIVPASAAGLVKEEDALEEIAASSGVQDLGPLTSERFHDDGVYWPTSKNHCCSLNI